MDDNQKKMLIIGAAAVALGICFFSVYHSMKGNEVSVGLTLPPPAAGQAWGKAAMVQGDASRGPGTVNGKSERKSIDASGPGQ